MKHCFKVWGLDMGWVAMPFPEQSWWEQGNISTWKMNCLSNGVSSADVLINVGLNSLMKHGIKKIYTLWFCSLFPH